MTKPMRYYAIRPERAEIVPIEAESFEDALKAVGLEPGSVDHGSLQGRLAIVVHEYSLFHGKDAHYFSIGRKLYAGGALVYRTDEQGETISFAKTAKFPLEVRFYRDADEVAWAIQDEEIEQPASYIGSLAWVWPQPAPAGLMRSKGNSDEPDKED